MKLVEQDTAEYAKIFAVIVRCVCGKAISVKSSFISTTGKMWKIRMMSIIRSSLYTHTGTSLNCDCKRYLGYIDLLRTVHILRSNIRLTHRMHLQTEQFVREYHDMLTSRE